MNMSLPLTGLRGYVVNEFSTLHIRALRTTLWAKLMGKSTELAKLPEGTFQSGLNRKMLGLNDIPVEKIIGTLYRHSDFDDQFRPLKKHLRDRWVNIYLLHVSQGWPPILLHKVGDRYYVEDGHHRVSVAHALGIVFIQAMVWEYPDANKLTKKWETVPCKETNAVRKYVTATD